MASPPNEADPAQQSDASLIDWDELKQRMREAVRVVIQDLADERGLSYDKYLDRHFASDTRQSRPPQ
jgi:hypothetical protein